jgi:hypothetical protein
MPPAIGQIRWTDKRGCPIVSRRVAGPDFICIGMIKAGTGWLYDQLKSHPDFWMPPVKEIRYLTGDAPKMRIVKKRWHRLENPSGPSARKLRSRDERAYQFVQEASALSGEALDFKRYASLFRHKGELLSGDISPIYSRLKDKAVSRIAENLPDTKIILLLRDPVARAWSGISMLHRHGKFDVSLLSDVDRFRTYCSRSNKAERHSFPSQIVERWRRCAPDMQFRWFFFDDIEKQPDNIRRDILLYLGADPGQKSGELPADHNRKAHAGKLVLTEPIKGVLVDHFRAELRACADVLGGHARSWAARYGL